MRRTFTVSKAHLVGFLNERSDRTSRQHSAVPGLSSNHPPVT